MKHGKILKRGVISHHMKNCMQQGQFEEVGNSSNSQNLSHFMKTAGALTGSIQPASSPYPEPAQ
jgi:hypothetical protein